MQATSLAHARAAVGRGASNPRLPRTSPKWDSVAPLVKLGLNALLHLLQQATDTRLVAFLLQALEPGLGYVACFPRLSKLLLKVCTQPAAAPARPPAIPPARTANVDVLAGHPRTAAPAQHVGLCRGRPARGRVPQPTPARADRAVPVH